MKNGNFAEIYSRWISSHDDETAIAKKSKSEEQKHVEPTIKELKKMKIQDELDLHTYKLEQALFLTKDFIEHCKRTGLKKVRIITGKGLHSPNYEAVIRPAVIEFLRANYKFKMIETNPKPQDGGTGALILFL